MKCDDDRCSRNIELKARCRDLLGAERIARSLGAIDAGLLVQTDTYFHVTHGRLKLREIEPDRAELIWYDRPTDPAARCSRYVLTPVSDPQGLTAALAAALGIRGKVRKRRRLLHWQNVRIHLDEVQRLGQFIEFEAVLEANEPEAIGHDKIAHLTTVFGIRDEDRISTSYAALAGVE